MTLKNTHQQPATDRAARSIHLGLDLTGAGARRLTSRVPVASVAGAFDAERLADLVASAQRGALDFVAIDDSFRLQPETVGLLRGRLDAAVVSSRLAKVTRGIGLVATISPELTDPGHVATALQTISRVSGGRAGWQVDGGAPQHTVSAVTRAVSSVAPTVVRVRTAAQLERAATYADVLRIGATSLDQALEQRARARTLAVEAGRDADDLLVLVDVYAVTGPDVESAQTRLELLDAFEGTEVVAKHSDSYIHVGTPLDLAEVAEAWFEAGAADGFVITPSSLVADVIGVVDGVVPALRASGTYRREYPGATLRESLGLAPSGADVLTAV